MAPEEIKKKRKKNAPDKLQPQWMHPPDEKNPILNPKPVSEERKRKEKEEWDASIKFMQYHSVTAPLKPAPPGKLLTLVGAFLTTNGFHNTSRLYTTQLASRKKLDAWDIELGVELPKGFPDLVTIYNSWYEGYQESAHPDAKNDDSKNDANAAKSPKKKGNRNKVIELKDEDTSSSGSTSSSSGSSGSSSSGSSGSNSDEHDSDVQMEDAPPTKLERPRHSKPSPSSSPSSTSDSDADDEKEAKPLSSSGSSSTSDSDADDEKDPIKNKSLSKKKGTSETSIKKKRRSSSEPFHNPDPPPLVEKKSNKKTKSGPGEPVTKVASKKASSKDATSKDSTSKKATCQDAIAIDATSTTSKKPTNKDATIKNALSKKANFKETTSEDTSAKKSTSKDAISIAASSKKATSKNAFPKNSTTETITPKNQESIKLRKKTKSIPSSSSSSCSTSSSSESSQDDDPAPVSKPQAVTNLSSSIDSSSSSSFSPLSSHVEVLPPPMDSRSQKKPTKEIKPSKHGVPTLELTTDSSVTLEVSSPIKVTEDPTTITSIISTNATPSSSSKRPLPASSEDEAATQDNRSTKKPRNAPFQRIPSDTKVDPKLASNAYRSHDYGDRAHNDLSVTRGKGFQKEKNKKKRGSYRGGAIDVSGGKGVKFDE